MMATMNEYGNIVPSQAEAAGAESQHRTVVAERDQALADKRELVEALRKAVKTIREAARIVRENDIPGTGNALAWRADEIDALLAKHPEGADHDG